MDVHQNYNKLIKSIDHWNQYRVPILRISHPDNNLQFQGAMRFYFQDAGQKFATKCVNVTSIDRTKNVIDVLIEKFRPDMRMLSVPEYGLYEIHENGEERKLGLDERPLLVQLDWNKDDREGRFLLRRMDEKTVQLSSSGDLEPSLKVKLSKKEKKLAEKQEKADAAANKYAQKGKNGIAEKLYNELPETSFTRSISNPEAVMKRRRAQKLEKRLQEFSLEGGREAGGTLRIFGEAINKDVSYTTLLLSTRDPAISVVKQILEKYGKEKEDPNNYCLVQLIVPPTVTSLADNSSALRESILEDHECPLLINQTHDKSKGILTFHVRPKPNDLKKRRKPPSPPSEPILREQNIIQNNGVYPMMPVPNMNGTLMRQNYSQPNMMPGGQYVHSAPYPSQNVMTQPVANDQILPALIQVREEVEDIFLSHVITHINPTNSFHRLAPTYVLYMVSRYRASTLFHPELQAPSRAELFVPFTRKIAKMIQSTIENHSDDPVYMAYWLANSSDLWHFYKQDKHLTHFTLDAQETLEESIHASFSYLLNAKQIELNGILPCLLGHPDEDISSLEFPASITPIINLFHQTMEILRKSRVNAALTIQIFSHLFHYISKWLIGIYDRRPNSINDHSMDVQKFWGDRLLRRISAIGVWAESQGLEQAAEYHLTKPILAHGGRLLSLNGQCDNCEQSPLPFIIPDEGYSSETMRYIPKTLNDFVSSLSEIRVDNEELCIFTLQPTSCGFWTVYFKNHQPDMPELVFIQLRKKDNSMGLSIIAAKGAGQDRQGIYVKNVFKNGAAASDGRLQAGDQLLEVNGVQLIDITQDRAAQILQSTGQIVTLKVAKQAAIYHNLNDLISTIPMRTIVKSTPNQIPPSQAPNMTLRPTIQPPPPMHQQRAPPQHIPILQPEPMVPHEDRSIKFSDPPAVVQVPFKQPAQNPEINFNVDIANHKSNNNNGTNANIMTNNIINNNINNNIINNNNNNNNNHHINQDNGQIMQYNTPQAPMTHMTYGIDHNYNNQNSHVKSTKKVSWLDNQPDQSLHTLIPLSSTTETPIEQTEKYPNVPPESLTLEDIDEVLSSKSDNWLEDSAGVIGTQEVYNDPRQRIVKEREHPTVEANKEKLSVQEKIRMFSKQQNK